MADDPSGTESPGKSGGRDPGAAPSLADLQHWTGVIGQAQQMLMEHAAKAAKAVTGPFDLANLAATPAAMGFPMPDPAKLVQAQQDFWADSIALWQRFLIHDDGLADSPVAPLANKDRRFSAPQWRDHPLFDMIRQSYLVIADHLLKSVETIESDDPRQKEQLRFITRTFVEAMSPANFIATNPLVLEKTFETRGENLLRGLEYMLTDISRGQLTQGDPDAFEVGRNIAITPGKVVRRTPLYELIQYSPATETVLATPLVIFPPWINRFYILDLAPENSFIRWAVEQGITVFVVSWKSADASLANTTMDDYVVRGEIDAIDAVRELLDVESVHAIGYCVAGTALSMGLAYLAARGEAAKVATATFFTAQVDFSAAGDLSVFIDEEQMKLIDMLSSSSDYLDGRYMAATFNLLRGRDLIWSYVVNNYLLGQDYAPFDLLHWNSDVTNLPAKWHRRYLQDFYRDNKLVEPGALSVDGVPIDLTLVKTPCYIEAGREDHIAPAESVWKLTRHFSGEVRFVLAGSGHIAGVVNPPAKGRYQHWTNDQRVTTLEEFVAGATEHKGSWWPDWARWLEERSGGRVPATGARIPGNGKFPALEDAPGSYVRMR